PLLDPFGPIRLPPTQNPLRLKDKTPHSEKCGVRQQSEQMLMHLLFFFCPRNDALVRPAEPAVLSK
ncbi:hypothetical protein ACQUJO_21390, partial [Ralstonia pseudosolanacearum]